MKNILLLILTLPLLFRVSVYAVTPTPKATPIPSPTPIEYVMPYPGLLPTHPLYFLKALRDRIIELLISDRVRKAEFYILQADKKLGMAIVLSEQGKSSDAKRSFTDSLSHRTQAVTELEDSKKNGDTTLGFILEKLTRSMLKHREVLISRGETTLELDALFTRVETLVSNPVPFSP